MSEVSDSTVLIVDDVAANRHILSRVLDQYHTIEAENGDQALFMVGQHRPDIILLDIYMPGIDGYEVCRRLKAAPETADIPVIFITGANGPGLAGKCLQIGAVDFITKPFDLQEIKARVRTHLVLRKTSEALSRQNRQLEEQIREQRLSSQLARKVLELVDFRSPRNINLTGDLYLFLHILSCACNDEGGDHHLISTRTTDNGVRKTMVSVKDQSGHSVNCILRSIITDLLHNSILYTNPSLTLQKMVSLLNNAIFASGLLQDDDFITALFLDIDNESAHLDYISAGHPSFFLIRDDTVQRFPGPSSEGVNLPLGFQEGIDLQQGSLQLLEGDRILLYTDGLTEIPMSCNKKALRLAELEEVLRGMVEGQPGKNISEILNDLPSAVLRKAGAADCDDFLRSLHDDVTVIGLELTRIAGRDWRQFVQADYEGIDGLVDAVFSYVDAMATEMGIKLNTYKMRMALTEGILNAWKHGNGSAHDKPIAVGWHSGNDFSVLIHDQGQGFDYSRLKNPVHLGKRILGSGRGIFCMKKYANFVGWQDGGSTLILSFRTSEHSWDHVERTPGSGINLWRYPLPVL